MMSKQEKINYLLSIKKYLNLTEICKACNISRQALYYAFVGVDSSVSEKTLDYIIEFIKSF